MPDSILVANCKAFVIAVCCVCVRKWLTDLALTGIGVIAHFAGAGIICFVVPVSAIGSGARSIKHSTPLRQGRLG